MNTKKLIKKVRKKILKIVILSLFFICLFSGNVKIYAEELKEFVYTFNFGDGVTYTITSKESQAFIDNPESNMPSEVISMYSPDSLSNTFVSGGGNFIYGDLMLNNNPSFIQFATFLATSVGVNEKETYLNTVRLMLYALADSGYEIKNKDLDIFFEKGGDTNRTEDYAGYFWGKEKDKKNFEELKTGSIFVLGGDGLPYAMKMQVFKNGTIQGTFWDIYNNNDAKFIQLLNIAKENGMKLEFTKEEVKSEERQEAPVIGNHSYFVENVNEDDGTLEIVINDTTLQKEVARFRYKKDMSDTITSQPFGIGIASDGISNQIGKLVLLTPDMNQQGFLDGVSPLLAEIKDNRTIGVSDKFDTTTSSDCLVKNSTNFVGSDFIRSYFAVTTTNTNQEGIIEIVVHAQNKYEDNPILYRDALGIIHLNKVYSISQSALDKYFENSESDEIVQNGNDWSIRYLKSRQVLYVYNRNNTEYFLLNMNTDSIYQVYSKYAPTTYNRSYCMSYPMAEMKNLQTPEPVGYQEFLEGDGLVNKYLPVLLGVKTDVSDMEDLVKIELPLSDKKQSMFIDLVESKVAKVVLRFFVYGQGNGTSNNGQNPDQIINITEDTQFLSNSDGSIVEFDITSMLTNAAKNGTDGDDDISNAQEIMENEGTLAGEVVSEQRLLIRLKKFNKVILKYGRVFISFLIFIAVIWCGIFAMLTNQDAQKRALIKDRLKYIACGTIIFASVVFITPIILEFTTASFAELGASEAELKQNVEINKPLYDENFFLSLIASLINMITDIYEWLIEFIFSKAVSSTDSPLDMGQLIFNKQGVDVTLHPFSILEWNRYMYVYKALTAMTVALVAIALAKFACEMIYNAGNSEKIAETKQSIIRLFLALIATALGPYVVRMFLLLFNSLIDLVPLETFELDLKFDEGKVVGACANFMFVSIKVKIYLMFVVRKIMLAFILFITPIVFGMWAISNKFRTLSLWIGELFTNAAMQFCYAVVFYILVMITFENQNQFLTLVAVLLIMRLADFLRDSLQGLTQKWGGVDEKGVAEGIYGKSTGIIKKGVDIQKGMIRGAGGLVMRGSKFVDSDGISKGGKIANNIGAVMSGNYSGVISEKKRLENVANHAKGNASQLAKDNKEKSKQIDSYLSQSDNHYEAQSARLVMDKIMANVYTDQEYESIRSKGGVYDELAKLYEGKKEEKLYREYEHKARAAAGRATGIISGRQNNLENQTMEELRNQLRAQETQVEGAVGSGNAETIKKGLQIQQKKDYLKERNSLANETAQFDYIKQLYKNGEVNSQGMLKCCENVSDKILSVMSKGKGIDVCDSYLMEIQNEIQNMLPDCIDKVKAENPAHEITGIHKIEENINKNTNNIRQIVAMSPVNNTIINDNDIVVSTDTTVAKSKFNQTREKEYNKLSGATTRNQS